MELTVGEILTGKVTGITKFGAFVALPKGKTGMVHISEVAQAYVSDIREHLSEGQEVQVKVIAVDETGRVNLSIKKAQPRTDSRPSGARREFAPRREGAPRGNQPPRSGGNAGTRGARPSRGGYGARQPKEAAPETFEDKLKHFMQDSESRMADIRHNMDKKSGSRRRK